MTTNKKCVRCMVVLTQNEFVYSYSGRLLCFRCTSAERQEKAIAKEQAKKKIEEARQKIKAVWDKGEKPSLDLCCGECETGKCMILKDDPTQLKLF